MVSCPKTGQPIRLRELRSRLKRLQSAGSDAAFSGLLVPDVLLDYAAAPAVVESAAAVAAAAELEPAAQPEPGSGLQQLKLPPVAGTVAAVTAPAPEGEQPWAEPATPEEEEFAAQHAAYLERRAAFLAGGRSLFSVADTLWLSGEDGLLADLLERKIDDGGGSNSVEGLRRLGTARLRGGRHAAALAVFDQALATRTTLPRWPAARRHCSGSGAARRRTQRCRRRWRWRTARCRGTSWGGCTEWRGRRRRRRMRCGGR